MKALYLILALATLICIQPLFGAPDLKIEKIDSGEVKSESDFTKYVAIGRSEKHGVPFFPKGTIYSYPESLWLPDVPKFTALQK